MIDRKKVVMPKYKTRHYYPVVRRRGGNKCFNIACFEGIIKDPKGERLCLFCGGSGEIKVKV